MTDRQTLSQMHPNGIPSKDAKRVIVEVVWGTKSVAEVANPYANASVTYTLDLDPEFGGTNIRDLRAKLDQHLKDGDIVMMRGSPPCDQVSVMNTNGPNGPRS